MEFQALFKCRKCKISAESSFINSDNYFVRCPRCRRVVPNEVARIMFLAYGEYLRIAKIRYDAAEAADPARIAFMRMDNVLHPSRYPFANIVEPDFPFFISLKDYFRHIYPYNE